MKNSSADYENFYPKEKKEIPKGDDQKSESKGKKEFIFQLRTVLNGLPLGIGLEVFILDIVASVRLNMMGYL